MKEPDGEADPPSRRRLTAHGRLPWAVGAAVALAQVAIVAFALPRARPVGAVVLAVVTLAVVGVVGVGVRRR